MIISKKTQDIIRVLLNEKKGLTMRELARKSGVSLGMTAKVIKSIDSCGYLEKRNGLMVMEYEKLLKAWAYASSIKENLKIEFIAAERPQYLIKKISNLLKKENYAFTLFSATEIISPYVAPNKVHLYISNEKSVHNIFVKNGILPAEEGNIICYRVGKNHFYGARNIRGVKIISLPQLYADLISYGGRGEEAAEQIIKLSGEKNV